MERNGDGMPNPDDSITRGPDEKAGVWWCDKCERRITANEKMFRADGVNYCAECAEQWGVTHEVRP